MSISHAPRSPLQKLLMQFYHITILIFGLSEREGLILDQCGMAGKAGKAARLTRLARLARPLKWKDLTM